jgi:hypothetical protein
LSELCSINNNHEIINDKTNGHHIKWITLSKPQYWKTCGILLPFPFSSHSYLFISLYFTFISSLFRFYIIFISLYCTLILFLFCFYFVLFLFHFYFSFIFSPFLFLCCNQLITITSISSFNLIFNCLQNSCKKSFQEINEQVLETF